MQSFDYHTALTIALGLLLLLAIIRIYQIRSGAQIESPGSEELPVVHETRAMTSLLEHDDIHPLLNDLSARVEEEYGFLSPEFTLEKDFNGGRGAKSEETSAAVSGTDRLILIDKGLAVRFRWQGSREGSASTGQVRSVEQLTKACVRNVRRIQRYKQLANHDPLTGLYNTAYLKSRLGEELERAKRFGRSVALLVLDIDHFKRINDENGHLAGDRVLKHLANLILEHVRSIDIVCRYGGDEICVILPDATESRVRSTLVRLQKLIQGRRVEECNVSFSVSIGAAISQAGEMPQDALFDKADRAMLTAKEKGRNQWYMAMGNMSAHGSGISSEGPAG